MWDISNMIRYKIKAEHVKFNPVFALQKQQATRRKIFAPANDQNLRRNLINCYIWSIALCGAEN